MIFLALFLVSSLALLACQPPGDSPTLGQEAEPGRSPHQDVAGAGSQGFPVHVADASGAHLTFYAPPGRIISLVPSATQTLVELGGLGNLAARTEFDTDARLAGIPSVGGGLDPNLESLVSLDPDLVIRFAGDSDTDTPARLNNLGIRHWAVRLDRISDVQRFVSEMGAVLGAREKAEKLLLQMEAALSELEVRVKERPRKRVAYVLGGNPPWVAGPGTFIDELLTLAGGENSFSDLETLYGPVSSEEFLVRDIDLILAPEGEEILLPSSSIPVKRVSPSVELPGPSLSQAALEVARLLHPEVFR